MRISLCNEVLREFPIGRQANYAAALGYDGLELAPFTLDADAPHALSDRVISRIRSAIEAEGLVVSGLHWLLVAPSGLSITSGDSSVQRRTEEVMRGVVDLCAALGGAYLIHGSPGQRSLAPGREEEGRANAMRFFEAAAGQAERANVVYCLEPLSGDQANFVTSLAEAGDIVERVARPSFASMLDTSSAGASEKDSVPDLLRSGIRGGLIRHVHFNDPNRRGPGQGDLEFGPIVATLHEVGYDGWIGVEPFVYEPDGTTAAARSIGYVRGISEGLLT